MLIGGNLIFYIDFILFLKKIASENVRINTCEVFMYFG